jgi:hypothetical protein
MNTKLSLIYRDADNYSASKDVVITGEITQQQIDKIKENLVDGCFIIAHQVGLPTPSENFGGMDNYPNWEIDHVYTMLFDGKPTSEQLHTAEVATIDMTIDELAKNISITSWDINAELNRLELKWR